MAIDPSQVKRYSHGSRVPGWDSSVDLTKDPAVVPEPATTYVREHGWLSPTAMEQAACVLRLTPAYLVSVASFYDMFELAPKGQTDVYVCTNITCSLLGADELYAHVKDVLGGDPDFNVRAFECLGACDIAPMASVDGVYVGPLTKDDVERLRADVKEGHPVLPHKQLAKRKAASKHWNR